MSQDPKIWTRPNRRFLEETYYIQRTESKTPWFAFQLGSRFLGLPFVFFSAGTCQIRPNQSVGIQRARNLCSREESDGTEVLFPDFLQHTEDFHPWWEEKCKPSLTFDELNSVGERKNPSPFETNQRLSWKLWVGWNAAENFRELATKWSNWTGEVELKLLLACEEKNIYQCEWCKSLLAFQLAYLRVCCLVENYLNLDEESLPSVAQSPVRILVSNPEHLKVWKGSWFWFFTQAWTFDPYPLIKI